MKPNLLSILFVCLWSFSGCIGFKVASKNENISVPDSFNSASKPDTALAAAINWQNYFADPNLIALIDTALSNNQELNILLQEITISKNEVRVRKGEYLPFVEARVESGFEKAGKYTRNGALEHNLEVKPGSSFPEPLPDFRYGAYASWEVDVWRKLRNAKKAAVTRYLASTEGKNFMITNLVAEIAAAYYELTALDNLLEIVNNNIEIQNDAFQVIKQQKEAGKVSQLAVNRFESQVLNTQNRQYEIRQQIVETENNLNFLLGRFPQPIKRNALLFKEIKVDTVLAGIPSQLLENRPDIRQAKLLLMAAKLDVNVAKANFFPSIRLQAALGFQAFNPIFLTSPESFLYAQAAQLVAPLVNRNAIKAYLFNANAKQIQAAYHYERTLLNAYLDVVNQMNKVENYKNSYNTKLKEVRILTQSINISNGLFNAGRADYMEVLLTQKEALESTVDQVEIKLKQLHAKVNIYRALGGGWK